MHRNHITARDALLDLAGSTGGTFMTQFVHGTLEVEIYKPQGTDPQQPHRRDEFYVVISGTGWFVSDAGRHPFGPGDFIFVPAGREHRFEDFTPDFATSSFTARMAGNAPAAPDPAPRPPTHGLRLAARPRILPA